MGLLVELLACLYIKVPKELLEMIVQIRIVSPVTTNK